MKTDKFQNKYRIPTARATWHDYNGGEYFITICTAGREHYFGEIRDAIMNYNDTGYKMNELIQEIEQHHPYTHVDTWQVMPNHVHLIVEIDENKRIITVAPTVETGHAPSENDTTKQSAPSDNIGGDGFSVETGHAPSLQSTQQSTQSIEQQTLQEKMKLISDKKGLLSVAIGNLKSAMTQYCHNSKQEFGWQTRFHDHIIRNQDEMNRIAQYIENNVTKWENDKFYTK